MSIYMYTYVHIYVYLQSKMEIKQRIVRTFKPTGEKDVTTCGSFKF